jgi:hypothetical protein
MDAMQYEVIVKTGLADRPKDHELSAALILAAYFESDVVFLRPQTDKTPDIEVNGTRWEIKSPKGDGKKTIENNLRAARKQSHNVVIDLRRTKMHQAKAIARIKFFMSHSHHFRRALVITKSRKIIEIL